MGERSVRKESPVAQATGQAGFRVKRAEVADRVLGGFIATNFDIVAKGTPAMAVAHNAERGVSGSENILREHGDELLS